MKNSIVLCVLTLFVFSMDMSAASVSKEAALQKVQELSAEVETLKNQKQ